MSHQWGTRDEFTRTGVVQQGCIALDGDKLKAAERGRRGGNGMGVNDEGVGYTETTRDRHAVAYSASFDGHDVSATLHRPNGSPGFSDQEIFSQGGAYLARQEMKS